MKLDNHSIIFISSQEGSFTSETILHQKTFSDQDKLIMNELVHDLNLSKHSAELLGSRQHRNNLLTLGILLISVLSSTLVVLDFLECFHPLSATEKKFEPLFVQNVPYDTSFSAMIQSKLHLGIYLYKLAHSEDASNRSGCMCTVISNNYFYTRRNAIFLFSPSKY